VKYYFVKLEKDWADEFDVKSLSVISEKDWKQFQEDINKYDGYPIECYFGTNEALLFESEQDIMHSLSPVEVSESEAELLKKVMKGKSFGQVDVFDVWDHTRGAYG